MTNALTFIGCGNMAQAMIDNLLNNLVAPLCLYVIDPSEQAKLFCKKLINLPISHSQFAFKCIYFNGAEAYQHYCAEQKVDVKDYILAIKPQALLEVAKNWQGFFGQNHHIISIMAGVNCASLKRAFNAENDNQPSVSRVMPNLCLKVGYGINGIYIDDANDANMQNIQYYFGKNSQYLILNDEEKMHAFTALFGSGPAYVFLLLEYLQQAMQTIGLVDELNADAAYSKLYQLMMGSLLTAQQSTDKPQVLREKVTSKGGTTEAALNILMHGEFQNLLNSALKQATDRSKALENSLN